MQKVFFYNAEVSVRIKNKRFLKSAIESLFEEEGQKLNKLNCIFCSDNYLLKINQKYLKHNTYTDVISFYFSNETEPVFGEVYISIDRIKENSRSYQAKYSHELFRIIIHAALHLCGYNDKSKNEKIEMRRREDFYLKKFLGFT